MIIISLRIQIVLIIKTQSIHFQNLLEQLKSKDKISINICNENVMKVFITLKKLNPNRKIINFESSESSCILNINYIIKTIVII